MLTSRTFGCQNQTIICGAEVSPSSLDVTVGGIATATGYALTCSSVGQCTCNGSGACTYSTELAPNPYWTITNTSIASVSGNTANVTVSGKTLGGATLNLGTSASCSATTNPAGAYRIPAAVSVCGTPNGESTAFYQWGDNDPLAGNDPAAAGFIQTLSPAASQFGGGSVTESNASPATDGCYFNGSSYPPAAGVTGSTWTVGSDARWGPDYVAPAYARLGYYQTTRPAMGLALPCNYTLYQRLSFKCPSSSSPVVFDSLEVLNTVISGTGLTNSRAGVSASRSLKAY